jgi:ATP-dependent DNA helicase RecQ
MIDESPAADEYKQVQRGKLDALLALAEATDCRRVRLLSYFGEASQPCGNCDNCLEPPAVWDGTEAARMLLSTVYRVQQASGLHFGAGHIMDILRGKATEKVNQFGHQQLSTFGIGAEFSELQLRGVLRQLIATGALAVDAASFNTLHLTPGSRAVLRGEQQVRLRESASQAAAPRGRSRTRQRDALGRAAPAAAAAGLTEAGQQRFAALKEWRSRVAREHNLPAYVIFHDATLAAIAALDPRSLGELEGVSGIGAKKLETYGAAVVDLLQALA